MAQPSEVRVVNRALVLLGTAQRITSLDDGTPLAQAALDLFEDVRDEVLADHPWNFAVRRAALAEWRRKMTVGHPAIANPKVRLSPCSSITTRLPR